MKKFLITPEICEMPVVDMASGHVIARSFVPCFDRETLKLHYLELKTDGGDRICLPFSSVCFINDICVMVSIPENAFVPESGKFCNLLGAPLTAKAGEVSLFNFGSIAKTEVGEGGEMISLVLGDGHSFLIPHDNEPENAAVNEVFAAQAFNCLNNSLRVAPPAAQAPEKSEKEEKVSPAAVVKEEKPAIIEPETVTPEMLEMPAAAENSGNKKSVGSRMADLFGAVSAADTKAKKEAPAEKAEAEKKAVETAAPEKDDGKNKGKDNKQSFLKKLSKLRKFIAPIVAMLVFFVLYFVMFTLFIKV